VRTVEVAHERESHFAIVAAGSDLFSSAAKGIGELCQDSRWRSLRQRR
jgi:hypothetical protein